MNSKKFFYEFGKKLYQIDGFYYEYAHSSGIKENLLWLLYALNDGEEHSQKEICRSWDLPRTTINTIVKELEKDGYVSLVQIEGEKRELKLSLTPSGKDYADNILKDLYEVEEKAYKALKNTDVINRMDEVLNNLHRGK